MREKLEKDKLIAIQSKGLATISRAVPVTLDLEKAVTKDFDKDVNKMKSTALKQAMDQLK